MATKFNITANIEGKPGPAIEKASFQEALDFLIEEYIQETLNSKPEGGAWDDIKLDLVIIHELLSKSYKHSEQKARDEIAARHLNLRLNEKFIIQKLKDGNGNPEDLIKNLEWIYKELNNETNRN